MRCAPDTYQIAPNGISRCAFPGQILRALVIDNRRASTALIVYEMIVWPATLLTGGFTLGLRHIFVTGRLPVFVPSEAGAGIDVRNGKDAQAQRANHHKKDSFHDCLLSGSGLPGNNKKGFHLIRRS